MPVILGGEQFSNRSETKRERRSNTICFWTMASCRKEYSTLDKEIKAALNAIQKFEIYLIYKKFILRTDAAAMNKVLNKDLKNSGDHKFARWQALFSNFDFL
jgi:hypothetical protein